MSGRDKPTPILRFSRTEQGWRWRIIDSDFETIAGSLDDFETFSLAQENVKSLARAMGSAIVEVEKVPE